MEIWSREYKTQGMYASWDNDSAVYSEKLVPAR